MHSVDDCIFCRIVAGDAPGHVIHEDELTVAFLDVFPVVPGHTLIVTKEHFDDVLGAKPEAIGAVAANSVALGNAVKEVTGCQGLGVFQLNGKAAGQTVFHYHMHLIPRNEGEPLEIHSRTPGDPGELAAMAQRLRKILAGS